MKNNIYEKSLELHQKHHGKIEITSKITVNNKSDLALSYSPGVAAPCLKIKENPKNVYKYTNKGNLVAVISDGSAVLGLGNIGAMAGIPVMEGKSLLFKEFAGIDAIPLCLETNDLDEIVRTVKLLSNNFGGINLEDISAPRCFEIEERLINECDIPVFHDDQHGTAIVCGAALLNSLKLVGKELAKIKVVFSGAGAAAIACGDLLFALGVKDISYCDIDGALYLGRENFVGKYLEVVNKTNLSQEKGDLRDLIKDADVFIGLSVGELVDKSMIESMADKPIVFAMANPTPEISYTDALEAGAYIVGTGRSDYPNQINNLLAFPGVFKGALKSRAKKIDLSMKLAATYGLANIIKEEDLRTDYIIADPFDKSVVEVVSAAVYNQVVKGRE